MIKKALGTLAAFTGFVAAIVTVFDAQNPIRTIALWSLFGLVIVLLGLIVVPEALRGYRARRSLPTESDFDDRCSEYHVAQATGSEIAWIAELEASVYSQADAIPEQVLREWYAANPSGFSIIKGPTGKPIGQLDILPLRPSTLDAFCKGNIVESEIRGDSLYSPKERHLITALYVESVILRPESPLTPASALMCVLKNFPTLIERIADPSSLDKVYAIAATAAGEKLVRRLGFELEGSGERRKDRHHLFVARFSELSKRAEKFSGNQPSLARSIEAGL